MPVALKKLLLHPALVLLVGAAAILIGVPLDRFALVVMILVAALPSASNVSLLAERFGADNGRIARVILVSTALSFFSFSAAVTLFHLSRPGSGRTDEGQHVLDEALALPQVRGVVHIVVNVQQRAGVLSRT